MPILLACGKCGMGVELFHTFLWKRHVHTFSLSYIAVASIAYS